MSLLVISCGGYHAGGGLLPADHDARETVFQNRQLHGQPFRHLPAGCPVFDRICRKIRGKPGPYHPLGQNSRQKEDQFGYHAGGYWCGKILMIKYWHSYRKVIETTAYCCRELEI